MTREELIKKVALKMDEISSSDEVIESVGTGDNNPLYTQINNLLNESVNDVLMKAPIYRLSGHVAKATPLQLTIDILFANTPMKRKAARFVVPTDFVRLASITDDAFQRPITDLAQQGDEVDKMQHNMHLVAKTAKPVAVISNSALGREITCYSYSETDTVNPDVKYIKRYDNDKDTTAETGLDDYMIDLVSWVCAGKVFAARGDVQRGKLCDESAASLMI